MHMQRSGGRLRQGADQLASPRCLLQARVLEHHDLSLLHLPLSPEHCQRQIRHPITRVGLRKRRSAALGLGALKCTIRQAATKGGVHANCSAQPALPYDTLPSFHINLAVLETVELPLPISRVLGQPGALTRSCAMHPVAWSVLHLLTHSKHHS